MRPRHPKTHTHTHTHKVKAAEYWKPVEGVGLIVDTTLGRVDLLSFADVLGVRLESDQQVEDIAFEQGVDGGGAVGKLRWWSRL